MSPTLLRACVAAMVLSAATPAVVSAQIYSWKDVSGNLVLSDKPREGAEMRTFAIDRAAAFRTTKAPSKVRRTEYDQLIADHATAQGVNPHLVHAVIQAESAFNPRARSVKGAMGLMQLMPATAAEYGVADPYNPAENIRAGVAYLKSLLVKYAPRLDMALAAYNAGPAAVQKYDGVPPYRETKDYVAKIKDASEAAQPAPARLYRSVEIVDGRPITRYSTTPSAGAELVKR